MKSLNIHIIKGTLGRDARVNKVGERSVTNFSVATEYDYKKSDGQWDKETTWHNVCAWQGFGVCDFELLTKGAKVLVVGRERYRKYTDASGTEREVVELLAESVDILGPEKAENSQQTTRNNSGGRSAYRDDDSF